MDEYVLPVITGLSFGFPFMIRSIGEDILIGLLARNALKLIEMGDEPEQYRWTLQDALINPFARIIAGESKTRKAYQSIEESIDSRINFIR